MADTASSPHSTKQRLPIPCKLLFAAMSTNAFIVVLFYSELVVELLLNMGAIPVFPQTDNTYVQEMLQERMLHTALLRQ
jgi:hypothetical protein